MILSITLQTASTGPVPNGASDFTSPSGAINLTAAVGYAIAAGNLNAVQMVSILRQYVCLSASNDSNILIGNLSLFIRQSNESIKSA